MSNTYCYVYESLQCHPATRALHNAPLPSLLSFSQLIGYENLGWTQSTRGFLDALAYFSCWLNSGLCAAQDLLLQG